MLVLAMYRHLCILTGMIYSSEMPKVVGEFDATDLHRRINMVAEGLPGYEVAQRLACQQGLGYSSMSQIAEIKWSRFFRRNVYDSNTIDGQADYIDVVSNYKGSVDEWHVDTLDSNRYLVLPDILTTASCWPTMFAVGKIAMHPGEFGFWESEQGIRAIDKAITSGDAHLVKFLPGQVLKVPRGTIHKRDIQDAIPGSYRYFMRKFPNYSIGHAGTALGRRRIS